MAQRDGQITRSASRGRVGRTSCGLFSHHWTVETEVCVRAARARESHDNKKVFERRQRRRRRRLTHVQNTIYRVCTHRALQSSNCFFFFEKNCFCRYFRWSKRKGGNMCFIVMGHSVQGLFQITQLTRFFLQTTPSHRLGNCCTVR